MANMNFLKDEIAQLKAENRFIEPAVLEDMQNAVCTINGKKVINLTSNLPPYHTGDSCPHHNRFLHV